MIMPSEQKVPFVSYAQNHEDVLLWRALKHVSRGFYIDVGAHHPMADSVSLAFYERGWRGVHIEPIAFYADLLRKERPDEIVIQAALSSEAGRMRFFDIPRSGLSTGNADIASTHRANGFEVNELEVDTITLSSIFEMHGAREIHWLKIDVEGMEPALLRGWGRSDTRPWIVVVESTLPNTEVDVHQQWESMLVKRNYDFVHFDGLNRFYVSSEHRELKEKFRAGPNFFDDFVPSGLYYLEKQNRQLDSELDAGAQRLEAKVNELGAANALIAETRTTLARRNQDLADALRTIDLVGVALDLARNKSRHSELPDGEGSENERQALTARSIEDLLKHHNDLFVRSAYLSLLGREPDDEGKTHYIDQVRRGVSKRQIIADLRESNEGRGRRVDIAGLPALVRQNRVRRLPFVGPAWRLMVRMSGKDTAGMRLRRVENQLDQLKVEIGRLAEERNSARVLLENLATQARERGTKIRKRLRADSASFAKDSRSLEDGLLFETKSNLEERYASKNYVHDCWRGFHGLDLTQQTSPARPLLSLCITTYNRSPWLRYSLTVLLPQLNGVEHLVEMVVCDNASTDDTEAVMKDYAGNSSIRYFRNQRNVGMLGNLGVTANHARGKFVWVLGDDDILLSGTIETALKAIIAFPDIEFIYTNYSHTRISDPTGLSQDELLRTQTPISPVSPDRYVSRLREIAANTENFFTAIYCCIFRADHAMAGYNQDTRGRPFSSLLTCVPSTNYVLDNLLDRPAFWLGHPAVLINLNVSWLKHADLWVLERFPEMYERFQKDGVSLALIDRYRRNSLPGIKHHLETYIGQNSENLEIIDLACLFKTYRHLKEFQDLLPEIRRIIGTKPEFAARVRFEALEPQNRLPIVVEGPFVGSYSLAIVNRNIATAIDGLQYPVAIGPSPTEGSAFSITAESVDPVTWRLFQRHKDAMASEHIVLRYTYPPTTQAMDGALRMYHSFGWEESEFPERFSEELNANLDGMTVMSHFVKNALERNGVHIPVLVTGIGVDHLGRFEGRGNSRSEERHKFTFLHVSSCFARKGVDILIEAFMESFDLEDLVRLVIKTFPNPHNNVELQISELRRRFPKSAEIVVINEDWPDQERLAGLYAECDVLVAPSRGEGFGLPIAEAIWAGKPAIATGYGGQMDFLGADYPWLIDYSFQSSRSHFEIVDSYWAEPDRKDLSRLLMEAYETPHQRRVAIAKEWRLRLENGFTWADAANRILSTAERLRRHRQQHRGGARKRRSVAVVSSWNARCGIAAYTENLLSEFPREMFTVFANQIPLDQRVDTDSSNIVRCWSVGSTAGAIEAIGTADFDALLVQHQPGFFDVSELTALVDFANGRGMATYVILHNAENFVDKATARSLDAFTYPNVRIMVHTLRDLNLVKTRLPWALENTMRFAHGVEEAVIAPHVLPRKANKPFVIATFGFLLPHKGVAELIDAAALLIEQGHDIELRLFTARLDERSDAYAVRCRNQIDSKRIGNRVVWHEEFLPMEEVLRHLAAADLLAMLYSNTTESASGAVRIGLSSGTPVICSHAPIFEDVASVVTFVDSNDAKGIADMIATIMKSPEQLDALRKRQQQWTAFHSWRKVSRRLRSIVARRDEKLIE